MALVKFYFILFKREIYMQKGYNNLAIIGFLNPRNEI